MKQRFLTGLVIVLPMAITFWALSFMVRFITRPFSRWTGELLEHFSLFQDGLWVFSHEQMLRFSTTVAILFGLIAGLFVIGYVSRWVFAHFFWQSMEQVLLKVPVVNRIYTSCRDFITIIFGDRPSFSRAVWLAFPSREQRSLAFVTNEMTLSFKGKAPRDYCIVFLPGMPNPTVGFTLLCPKEDLIASELSVDVALKWLISCGASESSAVFAALPRENGR